MLADLIAKYDRPLPRYTSYPTAPVWNDTVGPREYATALKKMSGESVSLYLHLPFCAERCTFCACNVVITKRRDVISRYLALLSQEIELVASQLGRTLHVEQLHLGGGTPNYLEPDEMRTLTKMVTSHFPFTPHAEVSVEADPRWTNREKIESLRELGFNRISFGVQDVDPKVQHAINRIQKSEEIAAQIAIAREVGFQGINIDLIYGLPFQTETTWQQTLNAVDALGPDRIALFNFAFVPWLQAHHRQIDPASLPPPETKIALFTQAIEAFEAKGYEFIGMDHFAKPDDELAIAHRHRTLHRNFQGYTTREGLDLIGLGVSAIGEVNGHYVQNDRKLASYERRIAARELATIKGWRQSHEDCLRRSVIKQILCHGRLVVSEFEEKWGVSFEHHFAGALQKLISMEEEGLVLRDEKGFRVTRLGRLFLRNIATLFDAYLAQESGTQESGTFSRAI